MKQSGRNILLRSLAHASVSTRAYFPKNSLTSMFSDKHHDLFFLEVLLVGPSGSPGRLGLTFVSLAHNVSYDYFILEIKSC
jgi:hypothetical protein